MKTENKIYIAADSAACAGVIVGINSEKLLEHSGCIIGITGTPAVLHVIETLGIDSASTLHAWAWTALKPALKEAGLLESGSMSGRLIIARGGDIYTIDHKMNCTRCDEEYASIGSGSEVACGAMYVTKGLDPVHRLTVALEAATYHISNVRPPFIIRTMDR